MHINLWLIALLSYMVCSVGSAAVPTPVTSTPPPGQHGFPFLSTTVDLASHGYVETEVLFTGTAQAFIAAGVLGDDGIGRSDRIRA